MMQHSLYAFIITLVLLISPQSHAQAHPGISGGTDAEIYRYPYFAIIGSTQDRVTIGWEYCSGVLVAPSWVLSAAHCFENEAPNTIKVLIGVGDIMHLQPERIVRRVSAVYPYAPGYFIPDIALLKLNSQVPQTTPPVTIVDVPLFIGEHATLVGFGETEEDTPATDVQQ
ncbi:MAG: S1 family peptidase, partial [Enterobacteriaceae bacterium]